MYNVGYTAKHFSVMTSVPGTSGGQPQAGPPLLSADSSSDDSGYTNIKFT